MMLHSYLHEHHHAQQTNLTTYQHPNSKTLTLILKLGHMFLHVASTYWVLKLFFFFFLTYSQIWLSSLVDDC
jgi:hypothetical protein